MPELFQRVGKTASMERIWWRRQTALLRNLGDVLQIVFHQSIKIILFFFSKKIFAATLLIFVFVQGLVTFYLTFTNFVLHSENSSLDFSKLFGFIVTLIYSLFFYFYFIFLHKIFLALHPSLTSSKCFSTLFKIVSGIFVFIIALLSLLIIYSFFHFNIITFTLQNTFNNQVRIFMAIFSWAGLFCQLYLYFSFFKKILENFPLTMDPIFKFFKLEIEIG